MAGSTVLTLGSPIKDHLAPSMLGPAGAGSTTSTVSGVTSAAALTSGKTVALTAATGTATTAAATTAATTCTVICTIFHLTAAAAIGYLTYRGVKALLSPEESTTA